MTQSSSADGIENVNFFNDDIIHLGLGLLQNTMVSLVNSATRVDALCRKRKPSITTKRATVKRNLDDKLKVGNAVMLAFIVTHANFTGLCVVEAAY